MSVINDMDLTAFAFKEAVSREKHMLLKLKAICRTTGDNNIKNLCTDMLASSQKRIVILQREMKNLNIK